MNFCKEKALLTPEVNSAFNFISTYLPVIEAMLYCCSAANFHVTLSEDDYRRDQSLRYKPLRERRISMGRSYTPTSHLLREALSGRPSAVQWNRELHLLLRRGG